MRPTVPGHPVKTFISRSLLVIALAALLIPMSLSAFAQEERATEKAAIEKSRQEAAARQQASPEVAKQDEAKKSEDEKGEDDKKPADPMSAATFTGLKLRSIGPAFTSGRVIGFAVDPNNPSRYFVAAASGGVWKTSNSGTTWTPVFDKEGSYSIGCIALDPSNPKVLYSAAKYPSSDDPSIFKSTDGGVKWKPASRGVSGGIIGLLTTSSGSILALGKESGLWRSTDGAATWTKIGEGLPSKEVNGLAVADTSVYVAAKNGLFRSDDGGARFTMSDKREIEAVAVDAKGNVYIATDEGVGRSTDGGKKFTAFNDGLTNEDVRSLFAAGTRLYAGTAGGGVFSTDLP